MAFVADLIKTGIRLAFALMALGQFPAATHWLMEEAAHGPRLVSLRRFNHLA